MHRILLRRLTLLPAFLLTVAAADRVTLVTTGLPGNLPATVLVGRASLTSGKTLDVPAGTYTVTPRPVASGAQVYVAAPTRLTVRTAATLRVAYTRLPPGSADPFFGTGGTLDVPVNTLDVFDTWLLTNSGDNTPFMSTTGSNMGEMRAVLVRPDGRRLGSMINVTTPQRTLDWAYLPTPLIPDRDGYLMGLSGQTNTLVRFTAQGTLDPAWKTPSQPGVLRGLLRLPEGGVLAYGGGQGRAQLFRFTAAGQPDAAFGLGGTLELPAPESGLVHAARVLKDGRVRLLVTSPRTAQLLDLSPDGALTPAGPTVTLPYSAQQSELSNSRLVNAVILPDGSALIGTSDVTEQRSRVVRLTPDGQLDAQFRAVDVIGATTVAGVLPDLQGRVLAVFQLADLRGSVLIRYRADGTPDPTFGKGGRVTVDRETVQGLALTPNGQILLASHVMDFPNTETAKLRLRRLLSE
ncbi:hypothetical protein [Deinococcus soli (ex Cha et al. 2016)]|uniref:Delta-60 repeat protein n=2 Tax=Deinococcus soli (ex Cha et al. 2016) TaxID=1309411 RepID=A0ACC6KPR3_9DEIO|nr:hypothetical protein [Deinococcus soli (ex Cha et al. 2016)]MDR6221290.1 putative delta-60 repeat protein [Deinococcus soli (ex Cha et al. 2016)]MDR6331219.1 putative delta-60 repeat protein [Deinococcus soli (ex Cha et al. 2016)]MDR6754436.1 putative delta-60 repeat protein [Deinococcus soli (ex Cha et al. 2016)]